MPSYASSARFGRIEPAGAPAPAGAEVPFVGPSPCALAGGSTNAKADVPEVVVTFNGRQSAGSWLFDTGAFVSVLSSRQPGSPQTVHQDGEILRALDRQPPGESGQTQVRVEFAQAIRRAPRFGRASGERMACREDGGGQQKTRQIPDRLFRP